MIRPPILRITTDELIVDNFAGGGGTSEGIQAALGRSPDIAINHDREAIAMHEVNHPNTKHYCEDVWEIDPVKVCAGRPVGLAWFSPDCKHFSKAKGGKPVDKNIRGLADVAVKWAELVRPRVIILENVGEFTTWGPLTADNKPCPIGKGLEFRRWKRDLEQLGYNIDYRELAACDYGTPTTRKRLFLVARCDGQPIVWPEATHGHGLQPYRTAAECIDWSLPTYSIFLTKEEAKQYGVKRPLADNTMRRIARGIDRYVIKNPKPFVVHCNHGGQGFRGRSVDDPMCTLTGSRDAHGLVVPHVSKMRSGSTGSAIDEPLHTVTAGGKQARPGTGNAMALVTPYIARMGQINGNGCYVNPADAPLTTITSKAEHLLVSPTLITTGYGERPGQAPRAPGLSKPLGTLVAGGGKHALVTGVLAGVGGRKGQSPETPVDQPYHTITAKADTAIVVPTLIDAAHGEISPSGVKRWGDGTRDIERPLGVVTASGVNSALISGVLVGAGGPAYGGKPVAVDRPFTTLTTENHKAVVSAFMAKHYGGHETPGSSLEQPVDTITAQDHNALVTANVMTNNTGHSGGQMDLPLPTVTSGGHQAVVASSIVKLKGTCKDGQPIDEPVHTVQAGGNHYGEVRAFLMRYHASGGQWNTPNEPMPTVLANDSIGLVTVAGEKYYIVDIAMRMLAPRELYRAQGFPDSYVIDPVVDGRKLPKDAQVRMVGNSVCPPMAEAMVRAQFMVESAEDVA